MQLLKELRNEKGWTMKDVAKLLNTSDKNIWAWENDIAKPGADMLIKLGDLYEVSVDALLNRTWISDSIYARMKITKEEEELLISFRKLSKTKQGKVLGYIDAIEGVN